MNKTTEAMVEAAAKVLNERLAKENGLFGVSRDMLSAALSSVPPAVPGEVGKRVAPVDVYKVLKRAHDNGRLSIDFISNLAREIAALSVPLLEIEGGDKGDGWEPIETAPKDETDILLADCRVHGGFMTVASYEIVDGSEWVWHTNDGPSYHTEAFTHWRPLPAAPSASIE